MRRFLFWAAAAGVLAGCGPEIRELPPTGEVPVRQATPLDAHCRSVAAERANDALMNGYDLQIQQDIFQEAYQDCMTWRTRSD
jgi:hypothetical protein